MKKSGALVGKFFFEIFVVSIGILLGFLMNDWREERNNQKEAKKVLDAIMVELEFNVEGIKSRLPYYNLLMDSLYANANRGISKINEISVWQGTRPPLFKESAYQMALSSGALNELDIELSAAISEVYSFQASFQEVVSFTITNIALVPDENNFVFFYRTMGLFEEHSELYEKSFEDLAHFIDLRFN